MYQKGGYTYHHPLYIRKSTSLAGEIRIQVIMVRPKAKRSSGLHAASGVALPQFASSAVGTKGKPSRSWLPGRETAETFSHSSYDRADRKHEQDPPA